MQVRLIDAAIYEELALWCGFFLLGVVLAASYDVLRLLRALIAHNAFFVNAEDLCYWLYVTVAVFLMLYEKNHGQVRGYLVLALLVGAAGYLAGFGRIVTPKLLQLLRRVRAKIAKPLRRARMAVDGRCRLVQVKCGKLCACQKKRLKKLWKIVKISVSKL